MGHELGKASVVTWKILLKSILTSRRNKIIKQMWERISNALPFGSDFRAIFVNNTEDYICIYWYLTNTIFVQEQRHKTFTSFLLSIGINSHEPVSGPVLGSDAEHS